MEPVFDDVQPDQTAHAIATALSALDYLSSALLEQNDRRRDFLIAESRRLLAQSSLSEWQSRARLYLEHKEVN